jgi:hypothetical protein
MATEADSKSDGGSKTAYGRFTSFLTRRAPPAGDKYEANYLREAFYDEEGKLMRAGEMSLRAMPKPMRRVYARILGTQNQAETTLRKNAQWMADLKSGSKTEADLVEAATVQNKKFVSGLLEKVEKDGVEKSVKLSPDWELWVRDFDSDPVTEAMTLDSSAAKAEVKDSLATASKSMPAPSVRSVDWNRIDSADLHVLILGLADGLEYDRFDTKKIREIVFGSKAPPTLNEFATVCATYIFVGNNATRLTNKVKDQTVGSAALGLLNKFGIVRSKINSTTLTLARWAIAFSPAIWALRNIYKSAGRLAGAGVITNTPVEFQDVALSGVSDRITNGSQIEDFLMKFNRALFAYKESKVSTKTTEASMDETAKKFHGISMAGAKADPVLQSWDFNAKKDEAALREFYTLCAGSDEEEFV